MRTVLVTGCAGFIGSHLTERLLTTGHRVIGVDNFDPFYSRADKERNLRDLRHARAATSAASITSPGSPPGDKFTFLESDLTDQAAFTAILQAHRPETIFHLAGRAGVRPSIADPIGWMHANVIGTQVVLSCAHKTGVARVIVASSSSVYGNCKTAPFAETTDVSEPISPYAASKRACELLAYTHHHLHRQPVAMLRFFTVFGPRQRPDLAITSFMRKIASGQPIPVFGELTTARDYTFIDDTIDGILAAAEAIDQRGFRIWNLGSDRPVTLGDLIAAIGKAVGREPIMDRQPHRPGDVERTWADLTRSRAEIGYQPKANFADSLAKQWAWVKST